MRANIRIFSILSKTNSITELADVCIFLVYLVSNYFHRGKCSTKPFWLNVFLGTGKTATTAEVCQALRQEVEQGNLPKFKYVELNGMRMTRPKQAYAAIWSQLSGDKRTADHASELLEEYFESRRIREPILLLVDELDQLMTRKQDVLYRIFDWPQRAKVIVLAIANTFDLPERVMKNRVQSRLGLSRETFQPYTFQQLQEIIKSRLGKNLSRLFEESGLAFIARKVASLSGRLILIVYKLTNK